MNQWAHYTQHHVDLVRAFSVQTNASCWCAVMSTLHLQHWTHTTFSDCVGWLFMRQRFKPADFHLCGPPTLTKLETYPFRTATTAPSGSVSSTPMKTPYLTLARKSPPSRIACSEGPHSPLEQAISKEPLFQGHFGATGNMRAEECEPTW